MKPSLTSYATSDALKTRRGIYDFAIGKNLTTAIVEKLDGFDGMSVLDIGCGYGADLIEFAKRYEGIRAVGIDQSPGQIEDAKKKVTSERLDIDFHVADAYDFDLGEKFDRILIRHVLHLVEKPEAVLERAKTHAKPGAKIVIVVHSTQTMPKLRRWVDLPEKLVTIETSKDLFDQAFGKGKYEVALHEQTIRLTEPEPMLEYLRSQNTPRAEAVIEQANKEIQDEIEARGYFEEFTVQAIVTIEL